jgi:hypothetical protein
MVDSNDRSHLRVGISFNRIQSDMNKRALNIIINRQPLLLLARIQHAIFVK